MIADLIYDIGMHKAEDTKYYLRKGFRVIAIEANSALAEQVSTELRSFIESEKLIILNIGIADKEGSMTFYRNDHELEWSSFNKAIGTRDNTPFTEMQVPCKKINAIIDQYGTPFYMKIDIEGYDPICINGMDSAEKIPPYISCEASSLDCLDALIAKGYTQFKLINQARNFTPFDLAKEKNTAFDFVQHKWNRAKLRLQKLFPFKYQMGSSGPFAEETPGPWKNADYIRNAYNQFYPGTDHRSLGQYGCSEHLDCLGYHIDQEYEH